MQLIPKNSIRNLHLSIWFAAITYIPQPLARRQGGIHQYLLD